MTKQAIKDACEAYRDFFKGYTKFPKFKSRKRSIPKFYQDPCKIQFTETHVKVEGFAFSKKKNKQKLNYIRLAEHGCIPTNAKYSNPRIKYDGIYLFQQKQNKRSEEIREKKTQATAFHSKKI